MLAVIQNVSSASVEVAGSIVAQINSGSCIFLAIHECDTDKDIDYLANKLLKIKTIPDQSQRFSKSLLASKHEVLIVPQYTLYANLHKNRPSFTHAMKPKLAEKLFLQFCAKIKSYGIRTATGIFRANMRVSIVNEGPVTFILDSNSVNKI